MGSFAPTGCKWMSLSGATSTATRWPSNGVGGVTATAGSSITASATRSVAYGLLLTATANGNVVISNHAGTALTGHTIPVTTTTVVPLYIPLGGPDGMSFATGISAKADTSGISFDLYFNQEE